MTCAANASSWAASLERDGYCIIPDLLPQSVLASLDADLENDFLHTPLGDGDFYGYRTKRFGSLLRRSEHAARLTDIADMEGKPERGRTFCPRIEERRSIQMFVPFRPGPHG